MKTQQKTQKSILTMTTEKSGRMKLFIAGSGTITIDWGDDSEKETHTLLLFNEDLNDVDERDKFAYSHVYSGTSSHTIRITGGNITHLVCENCRLTSLDVSRNIALVELFCGNNQLADLNVSENMVLKKLICGDNRLTRLDVIHNTKLVDLICSDNQLSELLVNKNTILTWLGCSGNYLTSLDVTQNTELYMLSCRSNQITQLDVSNNKALMGLGCGDNLLTDIDISHNTALTWLSCEDNQLTSLDLSKNAELTELFCQNNLLEQLDVSVCTALKQLKNHSNKMTSLDDFLAHLPVRIKHIRTEKISPDKYAIIFPIYRVEGGIYKIFLVKENDKFYLSDDGTTWEELDKIFELSENDVIKNLVAITKQYGCRKHPSSNAFTIECTPHDVHLKLSFLIQCLSFMLNMKIFYV